MAFCVYICDSTSKAIILNIAFFDFDHTISTKDSFLDFVAFSKGKASLYSSLIIYSPFLIGYKLGLYSGHKIKEKVLTHHFKGLSKEEFYKLCEHYGKDKIKAIINPKALERIKWHKSNGDRIIVVSASPEAWLLYWCEQNELEIIGSKLEYQNNILSGKLVGKNCNGEEKVARIKALVTISDFNEIYVYGNSKGDLPMLALADHKYYKYF